MKPSTRFTMFLVCCGLGSLSCESTSSGCPADPVTVPVDFFGDVQGSGEIKLIPGRLGSITLEGTVSRAAGVIVKLSGPGACRDGAIGATFHGVSPTQKGIKIEEGKFAAIFEPRPLGGKLIGGWDATFIYNNGVTRVIHGFVRDAKPDPEGAGSQAAQR